MFETTLISRFAYLNLLLLAYGITIIIQKKSFKIPPLWMRVVIILFYFLHLQTAIWALNLGDALVESQRVFLGIILFFIGYDLFQTKQTQLIRSIGVASFVILICAAINISIQGSESEISYLFGHKNLQSSILTICLPLLGILISNERGFWKIFAITTAVLITATIIYMGVRSNILALVAGVFLISGLIYVKQQHLRKIFMISFVAGLSLILIWLLTKPDIVATKDASIAERFGLWENTYQLIQDDPLTGIGAGNWQHHYTKYGVGHIQRSFDFNTSFRRPHNEYLRITSEMGIVGLLCFLTIICFVGYSAFKRLQSTTDLNLLISLSGLIGIGIISFFSFPHERYVHLLMSCLLASFLCAHLFKSSHLKFKNGIASLIILIIAGNFVFSFYRIKGEYYTKKSIQAQVDLDGRSAINNGAKALSKVFQTDPTGTPVYAYIGWGYHEKTNLDSMLYSAEQACIIRPFDYRILNNYGLILERLHYYRTAKKVLEESHRINPKYEPTILNLSVMEFNRGNFEKARFWLEQIENSKLKYPQNWNRIKQALSKNSKGE